MNRRWLLFLPFVLVILGCVTVTSLFIPAATVTLSPAQTAQWNQDSLAQARQIIQNRLGNAGLKGRFEVSIINGKQILVTLYRTEDLDIVKQMTTQIGAVEFVDSKTPYPEGSKFDQQVQPVFTESDIETVLVMKSNLGAYEISVALTPEGAQKLASYSQNNVGHYLLIVKDGLVISSPVINSPITAGQAVIQGSFSQESTNVLAAQLMSKRLPFQLIIDEGSIP
jgi:preprotein translocase subunit SecD